MPFLREALLYVCVNPHKKQPLFQKFIRLSLLCEGTLLNSAFFDLYFFSKNEISFESEAVGFGSQIFLFNGFVCQRTSWESRWMEAEETTMEAAFARHHYGKQNKLVKEYWSCLVYSFQANMACGARIGPHRGGAQPGPPCVDTR